MKRLSTFVFALLLAGSLSVAQTTGDKDKTAPAGTAKPIVERVKLCFRNGRGLRPFRCRSAPPELPPRHHQAPGPDQGTPAVPGGISLNVRILGRELTIARCAAA